MTDQTSVPTLVIDFGEGAAETFKAHDRANQAILVQYADDLYAGGFASVKAAIELTTDMVVDEERERFGDFLVRNGRAENFVQALYDGLDACWKGETSLPLESQSDSSGTSSLTSGDQSSKEGSSSPATAAEPTEWSLAEV